jgi:hypothetical protein
MFPSCWGDRPSWPKCLTTRSNYKNQLSGIPRATLPRSFQEAMIATRKLGFEYIWIDSICIIQGPDKEDWKQEALLMSEVYSNAIITLSILHSDNANGGAFNQRDSSDLIHLFDVTFQESTFPLYAHAIPDERNVIGTKLSWGVGNTTGYPLLSRAWCFQERLVAPRVLFFSYDEVIWSCHTGMVFEADRFPPTERHGWPLETHRSLSTMFERRGGWPNTDNSTNLGPWKPWKGVWNLLREVYTTLHLSYPGDRLPAIAAIAQHFSRHDPQDQYIGGLWKSTLITDLLWIPSRTINYCSFPEYVAPTWSWVSCPASHRHPVAEVTHQIVATVVDVALDYEVEANVFSRVTGGQLIVRGPALRAQCRRMSDSLSDHKLEITSDVLDTEIWADCTYDENLAAGLLNEVYLLTILCTDR